MSDLQGSNSINKHSAIRANESVHAQRMTEVIPAAIKNASPALLESMLPLTATMPDWYLSTRAMDRLHLKDLLNERWRLQGELDELLGDLQSDIDAFGKRLLTLMLQTNFNTYEDPETLSLHLYVPDTIIFGIDKAPVVYGAIRYSPRRCTTLKNQKPRTVPSEASREFFARIPKVNHDKSR
ncbi:MULTISPECIES: hypothetical protein [unclassified Pseudomonas]|uniref:hypothetical protein n=1 Tax=unclassified Pseudomonas TaxID=196821 RepID=UPI0021143BB7|nr:MULTISPECIES: hypothetical protein [unclassified Pseudomonas]